MTTVILFVLGAIIGSFLNVAALRLRTGLGFGGRSRCLACAKTLRWWELVPVLSFFLLRGRCSTCRARLSWQYPLVEIWTGLMFVTIFPDILALAIFCLYIVIVIYDLRHKIIPNGLAYAAVVLALLSRLLAGGTLLDWAAGPALFLAFGAIWLASRGRAIGFGDAKLALSVGLLLGGAEGFSALALAFWIGTLVTVPFVFAGMLSGRKKLTIKSEVPFAPFIVLGAWASLLFHLDIFHVSTFF